MNTPVTQDRPPQDLKLAISQLWQKCNALLAMINSLQNQQTTPAATVTTIIKQGTIAGSFEPLITPKSTGYLKYNGSAWMFLNQVYDISGGMTELILQGLSSPPAKISGKAIVYWLLASPGIIHCLFDDGSPSGKDYTIFDGTADVTI